MPPILEWGIHLFQLPDIHIFLVMGKKLFQDHYLAMLHGIEWDEIL